MPPGLAKPRRVDPVERALGSFAAPTTPSAWPRVRKRTWTRWLYLVRQPHMTDDELADARYEDPEVDRPLRDEVNCWVPDAAAEHDGLRGEAIRFLWPRPELAGGRDARPEIE